MDAVKIRNLTKYYGKARGVTGIGLNVGEGDFFGFIGPNGAGKSTTIRTMLGLISPSEGDVEIFGRNIRRQREEVLAEVGYMPSESSFYHGMRVRDAVNFSAKLRGRDCGQEARNLCQRLELELDKKVDQLSLGNRKKVSIVCALQHMPRLCVLDEPTSGLDPLMQREFYKILEERNAMGTTIFLSSHVLSEVQKYCRHGAVIREGKLLAAASIDELGHTEAKRVNLKGVVQPPKLDGIRNVKSTEDSVSFLYSGKPGRLLEAIAGMPLTDVSITEPDLEEIFMHYYEKEGE